MLSLKSRYDPGGGVWLCDLLLHTLEYADDANFIDEDVETASRRISSMEHGYKEDAAMEISKPKTKVMHVMKQEISPVRESDIAAAADRGLLPYKCDYCPEVFPTIESLNGHPKLMAHRGRKTTPHGSQRGI